MTDKYSNTPEVLMWKAMDVLEGMQRKRVQQVCMKQDAWFVQQTNGYELHVPVLLPLLQTAVSLAASVLVPASGAAETQVLAPAQG